MSEIEIIPYTPDFSCRWDEMVRASRNATFLLERGYMDYHSGRFSDCSLIALRKDRPVALLPLCHTPGNGVSSHAGLTYGGWILPPSHIDGSTVLEIFRQWIAFERDRGTEHIDYKPLPMIYASAPSQEDLYALWRMGFTLSARLLSSSVGLRDGWKFDMSKRQQVRKAMRGDVVFRESDRMADFMELLCECLKEKYDASPVHTLADMQLLKSRFPSAIRLFTAEVQGDIQAGVIIYDTGLVAHSQYAATTPYARKNYLLTALYHRLMTEEFSSRRWFDFGTSNERGGRALNSGLLAQKVAMGGRGVAYDTYSLTLADAISHL